MPKPRLWICFALALLVFISHLTASIYALSPLTAKSSFQNTFTGSASLTVQVRNETISGMLAPAVINLINSGASMFNDHVVMKTKIGNQIDNATQNMEGADAANAIIGIEIAKAVKTVISSTDKNNQTTSILTIETSSTCKPLAVKSVACENTVTIKSG